MHQELGTRMLEVQVLINALVGGGWIIGAMIMAAATATRVTEFIAITYIGAALGLTRLYQAFFLLEQPDYYGAQRTWASLFLNINALIGIVIIIVYVVPFAHRQVRRRRGCLERES